MSGAYDKSVLLARLRVAVCRISLIRADIEEVIALLETDRITESGALYWLHENDVLDLCLTAAELESEAA